MRRLNFALLSLVLFLFAQPVFATTYYVGSCMKGAYASITAAVAAVPAGSTIDVCPGTYVEQVTISKDLTLQGITSGNSSSVIIAMPPALSPTSSITFIVGVYAQVAVTAAAVNINNITVDGTATSSNCPISTYVGIFYASGSSGTLNHVNTRHQNCAPSSEFKGGIGILAENGLGATQSVTIENSDVRDQTAIGIAIASNQDPPTLTVNIKDNNVDEFAANDGDGIDICPNPIAFCNVAGSISGNVIDSPTQGIGVSLSGCTPACTTTTPTISGNTVVGEGAFPLGIGVFASNTVVSNNSVLKESTGIIIYDAGNTVSSNRVLDNTTAIYLGGENIASNTSIQDNVILRNNLGIEFNCNTSVTVGGNIINTATTGLDMVPALFSGTNSFYNVSTIRTGGC